MSDCLKNFLTTSRFLVNLSRLPGVDFYCQSVTTPDINVNTNLTKYSVGYTYETDTQISYGNLTLTFIVDENLDNYNQVLNWMQSISPDENFEKTSELLENSKKEGYGFDYTDVELILNNSQLKTSYIYKNCVPVSLSGLEFNVSEDLYISASLTFAVPQIEITSSNQVAKKY